MSHTPTPRPLIAVSTRRANTHGLEVDQAAQAYSRCLWDAGGHPLLLPMAAAPDDAPILLAPFAGLLLTGGGDLDPALYGAPREAETSGIQPERDAFELALIRTAIALRLPIFAICRGLQALNVALGGDLHQDTQRLSGSVCHRTPDGTPARHIVSFAPASRLAQLTSEPRPSVNSYHHQHVRRLAPGLTLAAQSEDGAVEAAEAEPAVMAVQWHPERSPEQPLSRVLFADFIRSARAYALTKGQP